MLILIDGGSFLQKRLNVENGKIIFHCLHLLVKEKEDTDWRLLSVDDRPLIGLNGLPIEKWAVKGFGGLRHWWYRRRLPGIIRQSGAGLILDFDGRGIPRAGIPQCHWIQEAGKEQTGKIVQAGRGDRSGYFVFSEREKTLLLEREGIPARKIRVIYGGPDENCLPVSWIEKEQAKIGYAAGREYFLSFYNGLLPEDLIHILKAFSQFKKRQQSNLQLVFTGWGEPDPVFTGKLQSYKYRADVHLHEGLPASDGIKLLAAAYALLGPFAAAATGLQVLNAFQAGVPVILPEGGCQAEIAGDAALYAHPADTSGLADHMMAVYKDENLRNELIDKGKSRLQGFGWKASAQSVWEGLQDSLQES